MENGPEAPQNHDYSVPRQREENRNTNSERSTQPTCTVALFTTAELWEQPGCPASDGGAGRGGAYA